MAMSTGFCSVIPLPAGKARQSQGFFNLPAFEQKRAAQAPHAPHAHPLAQSMWSRSGKEADKNDQAHVHLMKLADIDEREL